MKYTKIIAFILLLCGICSCDGNSQNTNVKSSTKVIVKKEEESPQKIAYINLNKASYFIDRIDFKNEKGAIISSFDIKANNPFNTLDLPSEKFNAFGGKVYQLKDITPQRYRNILELGQNARTKNVKFIAAESQTTVYQKSPNYALVVYNLFLYDGFGETFENKSEIVLLNTKGEKIQQFRFPHIARNPLVTNNGKFLFTDYGGAYNCTQFEYIPQGFSVYDVQTRGLVYEESRKGIENLHPTVNYNAIVFPYRLANGYRLYKVYDFKNNTIYEKKFHRSELGYSSFVEKGMKLKDKNGEFKIISFENDFAKTSLNPKK